MTHALNEVLHPEAASHAEGSETGQFLSFWLDGQEYALDILRVQEIREWMPVTVVPNTASYVRGVMNLRGAVVPVIDLRLRLGIQVQPYTPQTVVIVIYVYGEDTDLSGVHRDVPQGKPAGGRPEGGSIRTRIMGVVVDAVAEVYDLASGQITPPPEVSTHGLEHHVRGLVTVDGRMITILDFDRMLIAHDMIDPAEGRTA